MDSGSMIRFIGRFWIDSSPVSVSIKILRSENAGDESRCRSGEFPQSSVPDGGGQPVHALSVDDYGTVFIFNLDPHAAETADGSKGSQRPLRNCGSP